MDDVRSEGGEVAGMTAERRRAEQRGEEPGKGSPRRRRGGEAQRAWPDEGEMERSALNDELPVIQIDGLPYVALDWLQRRVAHAEARAERWRQAADEVAGRSDAAGREQRRAFLLHALVASYEAGRWRRAQAVTLAAMERARPGTGRR